MDNSLLIQTKNTLGMNRRRNVASVVVWRGIIGIANLRVVLVVYEWLICEIGIRVILATHSDKENNVLDLSFDKSLFY